MSSTTKYPLVMTPALRVRTDTYLHIPETAGTTLGRIIEPQSNPHAIYTIPRGRRMGEIERLNRISAARRAKLQELQQHMGFR